MTPIELHKASMAALASHFETCPYRCKATHIKCLLGWDLVAIEERAWFAARKETLDTNARYGEAAS
jgi:hypothetical protein